MQEKGKKIHVLELDWARFLPEMVSQEMYQHDQQRVCYAEHTLSGIVLYANMTGKYEV